MAQEKIRKKIRKLREKRHKYDPQFSLRRFAARVGMSPTYLSKIERDEFPPPSEDKIKAIASILEVDPDELLALAGKISSDIPEIVRRRPALMSNLIREMESMEDEQIDKIFRKVKDGKW